MKKAKTWVERYKLALCEKLSINDIMVLRNVGQSKAIEIRKKAVNYCLLNNIEVESSGVPTEVVLMVTNYDLDYYYEKMLLECRLNNMIGGSENVYTQE